MWLKLVEQWNDLWFRARSLVHRANADADLRAEFESHLLWETDAQERQGAGADEARRGARVAFGSLEGITEACRDERGIAAAASVAADLHRAALNLRRRPFWTATVCLTLAFGIGLNVAASAVAKALLLSPLPYPAADRIVAVWTTVGDDGRQRFPTVPEYLAWRDRGHVFDEVSTFGYLEADMSAEDGTAPEHLLIQQCTGSLFRVLGVAPALGRVFDDGDDPASTAPHVAVISHRLWQRRFHGDPAAIDQRVRLDGTLHTIVGVMPAGFESGEEDVELWSPIDLAHRLKGSGRGWPVLARLRPDASLADARTDATGVSASLGRERGEPLGAIVQPLRAMLFGALVRPLGIVAAITAFVLLLAWSNVTGLLLVRAVARRPDFTVRWAMGAGRARLMREVTIEVFLLAGGGGAMSIAVAWLLLEAFVRQGPIRLPLSGTIAIDAGAGLIAAAIAALTGVLLAMAPAAYVWTADFPASIHSSNRIGWGTRRARRARGVLVTIQVAMTLTLLVNACLLWKTSRRLEANPLGGDPSGVATFTLQFAPARYRTIVGSQAGVPLLDISPEVPRITTEISRRLEGVPGVVTAAGVNHMPFAQPGPLAPFTIVKGADGASAASGAMPRVQLQAVTPHFFETLRIPLLQGRDFGPADTTDGVWVAMIDETMARQFWGARSPIGDRIQLHLSPDDRVREIVAVVGATRSSPTDTAVRPTVYTPIVQQPSHDLAPNVGERLRMTWVFRTLGDPLQAEAAVQAIIAQADPGRPPADVHLLARDVSRRLAAWKYATAALAGFAAIGMLLSATGVYGIAAYAMAHRSRELAIRRALGASGREAWRLASADLGWCLAGGVVLGLAAAGASTTLIEGALWGVTRTDVSAYVAGAAVMIVTGLGAMIVPVCRMQLASPATLWKAE